MVGRSRHHLCSVGIHRLSTVEEGRRYSVFPEIGRRSPQASPHHHLATASPPAVPPWARSLSEVSLFGGGQSQDRQTAPASPPFRHQPPPSAHLPLTAFCFFHSMETNAENEYATFLEKVKKTVYLDNLSPQVTESVIKTGFEQYGNVTNIHFIPNYLDPHYTSQCALVELETADQAANIIDMVSTYPFMMSGMPRPVRARRAEPEMFEDRPPKPGCRIQFYWLDRNDPDFQVAQEIKKLVRKHSMERSFLLKKQQEEEEKLSKQQLEIVKGHYQKYEALDSVHNDLKNLSRRYGLDVADDN